jgi:hypothetical protein
MATVGTAVFELSATSEGLRRELTRSEAAVDQFASRAQASMRSLSESSGLERFTTRTIVRGLEEIVPAAGGAHAAIRGLITMAQSAGPALAAFGQVGLIIAGTAAVAALTMKLKEYIDELGSETEWLQKVAASQKQVVDEDEKRAAVLSGLTKELATLRGDQAGALEEELANQKKSIDKWIGAARDKAKAEIDIEEIKLLKLRALRDARDDEELKKLQALRAAETKLSEDLTEKLTASRASLTEAILRGVDDEIGAERRALEERLRLRERERAARDQDIRDTIDSGRRRDEALMQSAQLYENARAEEAQKSAKTIRQIEEAQAAEAAKLATEAMQREAQTWIQATQVLIGQLQTRLNARKQFDKQMGQGATGLGVTDSATQGFARFAKAREDLEKWLRDIADLERSGRLTPGEAMREQEKARDAFRKTLEGIKTDVKGMPSLVGELNKALDSIDVTVFVDGMRSAREWVKANVDTVESLKQQLDDIKQRLTVDVPAGVNAAAPEVAKLGDQFADLAWDIYAVNQQLATYNRLVSQ